MDLVLKEVGRCEACGFLGDFAATWSALVSGRGTLGSFGDFLTVDDTLVEETRVLALGALMSGERVVPLVPVTVNLALATFGTRAADWPALVLRVGDFLIPEIGVAAETTRARWRGRLSDLVDEPAELATDCGLVGAVDLCGSEDMTRLVALTVEEAGLVVEAFKPLGFAG